jgi:hypothetical protein
MRRQIVEQSGANESLAPRLGLRWVAVAACVLILAVVGWQLRDPSVRPTVVPQIAEAHADTPVPVPVVEVEEAPVVSDVAEAIETVVEEPTVAEGGDSSAENLQARTLRFTTQRGTQIIWIIDPELEL